MKTNTGDFLVIASGLLGLFIAFFTLASMLSPAGMALVLILIVIFGLAMAAPFVWFINRLTATRQDISEARTSLYTPADHYAAPRPPQIVDVMRYEQDGKARPLLPPKPAPTILRTRTAEGGSVQGSTAHLLRFASLPGPARSQWSGAKTVYGECLKFFQVHGMIEPTSSGGFTWKEEFQDEDDRVRFVEQFSGEDELESSLTRTRTRTRGK